MLGFGSEDRDVGVALAKMGMERGIDAGLFEVGDDEGEDGASEDEATEEDAFLGGTIIAL